MFLTKLLDLITSAIHYEVRAFQSRDLLGYLEIRFKAFHPPIQPTSSESIISFGDPHFIVFNEFVGNIEICVNFDSALLEVSAKPAFLIDQLNAPGDRGLIMATTIRLNNRLATACKQFDRILEKSLKSVIIYIKMIR